MRAFSFSNRLGGIFGSFILSFSSLKISGSQQKMAVKNRHAFGNSLHESWDVRLLARESFSGSRLRQLFEKSFPFQFVNHALIEKLPEVDFSLYFDAVANQFEGVIDAAAVHTRRKGKFWSIKAMCFFENIQIFLLEA